MTEQDKPTFDTDFEAVIDGCAASDHLALVAPTGALYAFPLRVGDISVGSVDLYSLAPQRLPRDMVSNITVLSGIAARQVLRRTLNALDTSDEGMASGPYSRREMHQASGMVAAQLRIGVDDALLVLRGHAFATDRSVREVAEDVIARARDVMENAAAPALHLTVPLTVDAGQGQNWAEAH